MKLELLGQFAPDLKDDFEWMLKNRLRPEFDQKRESIWVRTLETLTARGLMGVFYYVCAYDSGEEWTLQQSKKIGAVMKTLNITDHGHFSPMLEEIRDCFIYAARHNGRVRFY